ncbi:hypothetical protein ACFQL0_22630 [Haloplanus litoreus]|uniref:DNA binding protein n=2 Tax=Haloplanus litoreus TaxID=767515 RepID=A0ABD6A3Z7_9EURY
MSYYERQMRANAAQDEQKEKSDYIAELAQQLDVNRDALSTVLSDASLSVVKALVVELGPGGGEPQANAEPLEEYSDGTLDGQAREDVVDVATARERVQTLVANSAGTDGFEERTVGEMSQEEVIDALADRFVTEDDIEAHLTGDRTPTSNDDGEDTSDYPDGTVGADVGRDQPTSNVDGGADDGLDDYTDGTIGGDL